MPRRLSNPPSPSLSRRPVGAAARDREQAVVPLSMQRGWRPRPACHCGAASTGAGAEAGGRRKARLPRTTTGRSSSTGSTSRAPRILTGSATSTKSRALSSSRRPREGNGEYSCRGTSLDVGRVLGATAPRFFPGAIAGCVRAGDSVAVPRGEQLGYPRPYPHARLYPASVLGTTHGMPLIEPLFFARRVCAPSRRCAHPAGPSRTSWTETRQSRRRKSTLTS